jgi:DNA-binding CsgD family transcriptional regulator
VEAYRLSATEAKVLLHLAQGLPPKWIASQLDISPNTVRAHLRNLYLKMHVNGLCDLIREYTRLTD